MTDIGFHQDLVGASGAARESALGLVQGLGATVSRNEVRWDEIEAVQGAPDWSGLDATVAAAQTHGVGLVLVLVGSPQWANGSADPYVIPSGGAFSTWVASYAGFAGAAAARYPSIVRWEAWSEPNTDASWKPAPSASDYASWFAAVRAAIVAANPAAKVAAGSLASLNAAPAGDIAGKTFLASLIGAGVTLDAVGVRPFVDGNGAPSSHADETHNWFDDVERIRRILVAAGKSATRVWITGWGWPTSGGGSVSEATQATYVTASLGMIRRFWSYVDVATLAACSDDSGASVFNGLVRDDGSLKPAALAFAASQAPQTPNPVQGVECHVGSFTAQTVTGQQTIRGAGLRGSAVILWGTRVTSDAAADGASFFCGLSDGITSVALASCSDDAAATSNAGRIAAEAAIVLCSNGAPTQDALANFVGFTDDGFTIEWLDAPASGVTVNYMVIGGDACTAKVGRVLAPASGAAQSWAGLGFAPGMLFTLSPGQDAAGLPFVGSDSYMALGAAAANGQAAVMFGDQDAQATTATTHVSSTTEVVHDHVRAASLASFDADGFSLSWGTLDGSQGYVFYLALAGGDYSVGSFPQPTSTGLATISGIGSPGGFEPRGAVFFGVEATSTGSGAGVTAMLGATGARADGGRAAAVASQSGVSPSNTAMTQAAHPVVAVSSAAAVVAAADARSVTAGTLVLNWPTADATARLVFVAAIGGSTHANDAIRMRNVLGRNAPGSPVPVVADTQRSARFVAVESGSVVKLSIYVDGLGAGSGGGKLRGLIFDQSGVLLVQGSEVDVADGQPAGWIDLPFDLGALPGGFAVTSGTAYEFGYIAGGGDQAIRVYETDTGAQFGREETRAYASGAANFSGSERRFTADLSIFATLVGSTLVVEGEEERNATLAFPEAQAILGSTATTDDPAIIATCGWYGSALDDRHGSFAIVNPNGSCSALVGERVKLRLRDSLTAHVVYAYVVSYDDQVTEDIALERRTFMAIGDLADAEVGVYVEIMGAA